MRPGPLNRLNWFLSLLIRLNLLVCIIAIVAIAASINIHSANGSIPPVDAPESNQTRCTRYLATPSSDRIDDWIFTFKKAIRNSPKLEQDLLECILDLYKMSETDQFMLRACRANPTAPFEELVYKALGVHLDKCEAGMTR